MNIHELYENALCVINDLRVDRDKALVEIERLKERQREYGDKKTAFLAQIRELEAELSDCAENEHDRIRHRDSQAESDEDEMSYLQGRVKELEWENECYKKTAGEVTT